MIAHITSGQLKYNMYVSATTAEEKEETEEVYLLCKKRVMGIDVLRRLGDTPVQIILYGEGQKIPATHREVIGGAYVFKGAKNFDNGLQLHFSRKLDD